MADADEDALPSHDPSNSTSTSEAPSRIPLRLVDTDPTEEAQDFRFLASLTSNQHDTTDTDFAIPRRGEKDFEPLPLSSQTAALDASRAAMHTALSFPRVHSGKGHLLGVYVEEEAGGGGGREGMCVRVEKFRGVYGRTMGRVDPRNRTWLWPEEALFLVERGTLDVRWPVEVAEDDGKEVEIGGNNGLREEDANEDVRVDDDDDEAAETSESVQDEGIPMSLQAAYASFIGRSGLTLERYLVFAGLRRSGYVLTRAPTWSDEDVGLNGHAHQPERAQSGLEIASTTPASAASGAMYTINRFLQRLFAPKRGEACPSMGPLVAPGLYRNYNDIFRALTLVSYYDSTTSTLNASTPRLEPKPPFRVAYNVWKPSTTYRKSSPPKPDFRIAVIDARTSNVPTVQQIGALLDSMPSDELPKDRRLEQRIKHGKKNVILAVVDSGVVSYLRLSETGFGTVKLFEEKTARGGKRGGHRGTGRGRGRGG